MDTHRINEGMRALTIVASIFVPLTFMAGGMVVYFWRKGWIGRRR